MKKNSFSNTKLGKSLAGKGFYVALCLCLVAVGVGGMVVYNRTVDSLTETPSVTSPITETQPLNTTESTAATKETTEPAKNVKDSENDAAKDTIASATVLPVTGEIINPYSHGELIKSSTTNIWSTHNGVDIAAEIGTDVKSMTKGTVTEVGTDTLWGTYVTIDHGSGIIAKYCNLNTTPSVKKGDEVDAGTIIGQVGTTAEIEIAEPPHIHFEVKQNDDYIDPLSLIDWQK